MSSYFESINTNEYNTQIPIKKGVVIKNDNPITPLFDGFFTQSEQEEKFSFLPKTEKIDIPHVGNIEKPFDKKTENLLYKKEHNTKFLNIAQEHLGIQEVTPEEYENLTDEEKQNTHMHLIGNNGNVKHQWCAHTTSHIAKEAGIDIGQHKKYVSQYIDWATKNKIYNPIDKNTVSSSNFIMERYNREQQIKSQFNNMKEGDLIVWKSDYIAELPDGNIEKKSSHIGILESVNPDGTITVIEGNANEFVSDENAERYIVSTEEEGKIGNQEIGDFKEVNNRDGVIRKTYTAQELANFGYSGYINMQGLINK